MDAPVRQGPQTIDFPDHEKVEHLFRIKLNKKLLQDKYEVVSNVPMFIQVVLCEGWVGAD